MAEKKSYSGITRAPSLGVAGTAGLIISVLNAYYVFLKYAKLAALQQATSAGTRPGA